jgi:hypothetical protein
MEYTFPNVVNNFTDTQKKEALDKLYHLPDANDYDSGLNRLLRLYTHLVEGDTGIRTFNFGTYNSGPTERGDKGNTIHYCQTAGCAVGELPYIEPSSWLFQQASHPILNPKLRKRARAKFESVNHILDTIEMYTMYWFNISRDESLHLFIPQQQSPLKFGGIKVSRHATKLQVADNILYFLICKHLLPSPELKAL